MSIEKNYLAHPLYILITLLLASITALFLGFTGAYIYSRIQNGSAPVQIPSLFIYNTIFLICSSLALHWAKKAYEYDHTGRYKLLLWATLVLTLFFLLFQILAWNQLITINSGLTSGNLVSYLYIISGTHFAHIIFGIPFLIFFISDAHKRLIEPASVLVYLSDPDKKRNLLVISIYWHFLAVLWIYLVVLFTANKYF